MDVAVMVLAHQANAQLRLLLSELSRHERARVFLHLDRKALEPPTWLMQMHHEGQVQLVARQAIRWGGFSIIEATRALLKAALSHPSTGTFILASGSCFPVHGVLGLVERGPAVAARTPFALWTKLYDVHTGERGDDRGAVFKWHDLDHCPLSPGQGKLRRVGWKLANAINRALPYSRRPPISVYKGSQWFCADRELAQKLLDCREYDSFFRRTFAPDELLFQSIFVESLRGNGRPVPPLISQWAGAQGSHFIASRPHLERTFTDRLFNKVDIRAMSLADIELARESGCLLARKCDHSVSQALLLRSRMPKS